MNLISTVLAASLLIQLLPIAGQSTIRGRVLDADGRPMANVGMTALILLEKRMPTASATTDAEGQFTMARVPAGRILLRAQPRQVRSLGADGKATLSAAHPPAYFPGVLSIDEAWPIEVGPNEVIELDFHMPPVLIGSIKALVTGPDGFVLEQTRVMRPEGNQIKNVKVDADGIGYAEDLREGRHVVVARARSKDQQRLAAFQIVQINPGELTVDLPLEPAAKITGRVVSDRGGVPPIAGLRVAAVWTDGSIDLDPLAEDEGDVGADGSFTIDGLFGTRAIRVSGLDEGWQVASIRQGRSDVTTIDTAPGTTADITITLTRR